MPTYYFDSVNGNDANAGTSISSPKKGTTDNLIKTLANAASGTVIQMAGGSYWTNQDLIGLNKADTQLVTYGSGEVQFDGRQRLNSGWTNVLGSKVWKKTVAAMVHRVLFPNGSVAPFAEGNDVAKTVITGVSGSALAGTTPTDAQVVAALDVAVGSIVKQRMWYWHAGSTTLYVLSNSAAVDPDTAYGGVYIVSGTTAGAAPRNFLTGTGLNGFNLGPNIRIRGFAEPISLTTFSGTLAPLIDYHCHYNYSPVTINGSSNLVIANPDIRQLRPKIDEYYSTDTLNDGNGIRTMGGSDEVQLAGTNTNTVMRGGYIEGCWHSGINVVPWGTHNGLLVSGTVFDGRNARYGRAFGVASGNGINIVFDRIVTIGMPTNSQISSSNCTVRNSLFRGVAGQNGNVVGNLEKYDTSVYWQRTQNAAAVVFAWTSGAFSNCYVNDCLITGCENPPITVFPGGVASNPGNVAYNNCRFEKDVSTWGDNNAMYTASVNPASTIGLNGCSFGGWTTVHDFTGAADMPITSWPYGSGNTTMTTSQRAVAVADSRATQLSLNVLASTIGLGNTDFTLTAVDKFNANAPVSGYSGLTVATSDATKATGQLLAATNASGQATVRVTAIAGGNPVITAQANVGPQAPAINLTTVASIYQIQKIIDRMTLPNPGNFVPSIHPPWGSNSQGDPGTGGYAYVDSKIRASDITTSGTGYQYGGSTGLDTAPLFAGTSGSSFVGTTPWMTVGDAQSLRNTAGNTRAQLRNMQQWALKTDGTYVRANFSDLSISPVNWGAWYNFWYGSGTGGAGSEDVQTIGTGAALSDGRVELQADGGGSSLGGIGSGNIYVAPNLAKYSTYLWHGFPLGGYSTSRDAWQSSIVGTITTVEGRLTLHDPNGPDDSAQSGLGIAVGEDWYWNAGAGNHWGGGHGHSNWTPMTRNWDLYGFTDIPRATLLANPPPPFVGSGTVTPPNNTSASIYTIDRLVNAMTTPNTNDWWIRPYPVKNSYGFNGHAAYAPQPIQAGANALVGYSTSVADWVAAGHGADLIGYFPWAAAGAADAPSAGNTATNTRVQFRNMEHRGLQKNGVWVTFGSVSMNNVVSGAWYNSPATQSIVQFPLDGSYRAWRDETNNGGGWSLGSFGQGTVTVGGVFNDGPILNTGILAQQFYDYFCHFYPLGNTIKTAADWVANWEGTLVSVEARLILHNPTGVDDRGLANILCMAACDNNKNGPYWNEAYHGGQEQIPTDGSWKLFIGTDIPSAKLAANPAPGYTVGGTSGSGGGSTGGGGTTSSTIARVHPVEGRSVYVVTSDSLTPTFTPTAGNRMMVNIGSYQNGTIDIRDNQSPPNVFVPAVSQEVGNGATAGTVAACYISPVLGAINVTPYVVTLTVAAVGACSWDVSEWSGMDDASTTSCIRDATGGYAAAATNPQTVTQAGGSTKLGDLVVSVLENNTYPGDAAITGTTGWTVMRIENDANNWQPYASQYQVAPADGNVSCAWTQNAQSFGALAIVSFKPKLVTGTAPTALAITNNLDGPTAGVSTCVVVDQNGANVDPSLVTVTTTETGATIVGYAITHAGANGTFTATAKLKSNNAILATKSYVVSGKPIFTSPYLLPAGQAGVPGSYQFVATGTGTISYASGAGVAALQGNSLNTANGTLTWGANAAGTYDFNMQATSTNGAGTTTTPFRLIIQPVVNVPGIQIASATGQAKMALGDTPIKFGVLNNAGVPLGARASLSVDKPDVLLIPGQTNANGEFAVAPGTTVGTAVITASYTASSGNTITATFTVNIIAATTPSQAGVSGLTITPSSITMQDGSKGQSIAIKDQAGNVLPGNALVQLLVSVPGFVAAPSGTASGTAVILPAGVGDSVVTAIYDDPINGRVTRTVTVTVTPKV